MSLISKDIRSIVPVKCLVETAKKKEIYSVPALLGFLSCYNFKFSNFGRIMCRW